MPSEERIQTLALWLVVWFAILLFLLFVDFFKKRPNVGISMAYLFNFFMNYFIGALIYTLPWYVTQDFDYVYLGFKQCFYAIIAYTFGSLVMAPIFERTFLGAKVMVRSQVINKSQPWVYLSVGLVCYLILGRALSSIPTVRTIGNFGWFMLICAVCLFCWNAWIEKKRRRLYIILLLSGLFPFFTIFNSGFLSFGTIAVMTIIFFVASFYKPRWVVFVAIFLAIYLGLSVSVTYFRDRDELRQDIWTDRKSLSQRIERTVYTITNFEWVDLSNINHLRRIDNRLNQNIFIGHAIVYLGEGHIPFAAGATLWDSILALVPRILWPDKPVAAGGGYEGAPLMVKYTGMQLEETNTCWGLGHVLELYINYGQTGVIVGFVVLGALITMLDCQAAIKLRSGDLRGFIFIFLPTISFMGSSTFVEMTGTAVGYLLLGMLLHKFIILKIVRGSHLSRSKT